MPCAKRNPSYTEGNHVLYKKSIDHIQEDSACIYMCIVFLIHVCCTELTSKCVYICSVYKMCGILKKIQNIILSSYCVKKYKYKHATYYDSNLFAAFTSFSSVLTDYSYHNLCVHICQRPLSYICVICQKCNLSCNDLRR